MSAKIDQSETRISKLKFYTTDPWKLIKQFNSNISKFNIDQTGQCVVLGSLKISLAVKKCIYVSVSYLLGKCNSPVNIAAVIDVSDNLSPSNLPEIKNFLKRVANFFLLSTHASHMSVILAGSQVNVAIDPDSGIGSSKARFIKAVETSVKHSGGAWSVDEGLGLAKKVFTGSRNFVPRVALVITNGRQSNGNSDVLKSRARDLHAMGVYVYVVSVGDRVSRDELRLMVKDDSEYLYHVDNFKDLDTLAVNVSSDICQKHYIGKYDNLPTFLYQGNKWSLL